MLRSFRFGIGLLVAGAAAAPAWTADLSIYAESLQNNFLDYSYVSNGGSVDFASTVRAHGGTHSIAFAAGGSDAVKVANNTQLFATASYPRLHLWFYGNAAQCQELEVILERSNGANDVTVASGALSAYASCNAIVNGQWLEITVDFTASPISYAGTYDRISLFNGSGTPYGPVYFDDLSLQPPANDEIFKSGFEAGSAGTPMAPIAVQQNFSTPCADQALGATPHVSTERYTWQDSEGLPRSATLSHNDGQVGFEGTHGGELCDYTYHTSTSDVREVTPSDYTGGVGGFGYIVSHLGDTTPADQLGQDDSPIGHQFSGTFTRILNGRHHAILRFQLSYPRYYDDAGNNAHTYHMPVTIDWLIATGHDHPLWTVTYDLQHGTIDNSPTPTAAPANSIHADSRAPYGDMAFDGNASNPGDVSGIAWGDRYKFLTTNSPVTMNSGWTWTAPNTVPFNYMWTAAADAEMGLVQSQDYVYQDAGGYDNVSTASLWNTFSAGLPSHQGCPNGAADPSNYVMPCQSAWPYQLVQYSFYDGNTFEPDQPTGDKRQAWGTNFGFLGQQVFNYHTCADGSCNLTGSGYPYQSYSVYVVLDRHSTTPTLNAVTQIENTMLSSLSVQTGSPIGSGPAGVNSGNTITYHPAGYNRVYGTWDLTAAANSAALTFAAGGSGVLSPTFVLHAYTSALPPTTVNLDGRALAADADYFATVDTANSRLWITVNGTWTGSHSLSIN